MDTKRSGVGISILESGNYSVLPSPWPTPRWTQGLIMWPRLASHLHCSNPSLLSAGILDVSSHIQPCLLVKKRKTSQIFKCSSKNIKLCLVSLEGVSYHKNRTTYKSGKTCLLVYTICIINIAFILNKLPKIRLFNCYFKPHSFDYILHENFMIDIHIQLRYEEMY